MNVRKVLTLALVAGLSGCAGQFTLIDRNDGRVYTGSTDGSTMGASGNSTLQVEGETYTGPWIYQASGGSFSFANVAGSSSFTGSGTVISPTGRAFDATTSGTARSVGTATTYGVSAVGNGMINARSQSGQFIRCIFSFNTMQNTGIGECLRNDGRTYDLNVKR
jgi:hypothetical protein